MSVTSVIFKCFILLLTLTVGTGGVVSAEVQAVPDVGSRITITGGAGSYCFDTLQNLQRSEHYVSRWSGGQMDAFLSAHSLGFFGEEKAKVLAVGGAYSWTSNYGVDYVRPIELLIESPHVESGRNWQAHTCWWEFSQNADMDPNLIWWR